MRTIKFTALLLAITTIVSCQKEQLTYDSDPSVIKFTAGVRSPFTRSNPVDDDASAAFKANDIICVSADSQEDVKYTFSGTTWTPETDKYLKWDADEMIFKAYYPVGVNGASMTTFNLPADQTTLDKIEKADYMTYTSSTPEAKAESVNLELGRKMARVVVESTTFKDQYATGYTVSKIEVSGNTNGYTSNAVKSGDITVSTLSSASKFYALLSPTTADGDKTFFTITVKKTADETTETLTVKGIPSLAAGNSYSYKLVIGKNEVTIAGVTVSDWLTGVAIPGDEAILADVWDGTYATEFSGVGTKEDPFLINSAKELALLSTTYYDSKENGVNSYYKLMTDIDLGYREWIPIGSNYDATTGTITRQGIFSGAFDGNGHTIYGLKVTATDVIKDVGLFGGIMPFYDNDTYPNVQNLKIKDAIIYTGASPDDIYSEEQDAGILAGFVVGGIVGEERDRLQRGKIRNCHVTGKIHKANGVTTIVNVGGLIGYMEASEIDNCSSDVIIDIADATKVGGFSGTTSKSTIKNSHCKGSVKGTSYIGGFSGSAEYDDGDINTRFERCTTSVDVTASGVQVGGFVGDSNSTINSCHASGNVISTANLEDHIYRTGGFVGTARQIISHSYFTGTLTVGDTSAEKWTYYGAFIGNYNNAGIFNCHFDGSKNANFNQTGLSIINDDENNMEYSQISNKL